MTDTKFIMDSLNKQKGVLEMQGYTVAYICLYGSQNYGLQLDTEEYKSDIDMKAVIVPTLDDLVFNSKPISVTVDTEWGQCDLKDIRTFTETMVKANPAYIETLYTPYHIVDGNFIEEFDEIMSLRDDLVFTLRCQFLRAIYGMMCEKQKALCHPYPTIAHKIEKWGYDGKQAHHIVRLWVMMQDYAHNVPLGEAFMVTEREPHKEAVRVMQEFKLNRYTLESTNAQVNEIMRIAKDFKDGYLAQIDENKIDYAVRERFVQLSNTIIRNKIIHDIRNKR